MNTKIFPKSTKDFDTSGYVLNLKKASKENKLPVKVLWTSPNYIQNILVHIEPKEKYGNKKDSSDSFFLVTNGSGFVTINNQKYSIGEGYCFNIVGNVKYNIENSHSSQSLDLLMITAPASFYPKVISTLDQDKTKKSDKKEESEDESEGESEEDENSESQFNETDNDEDD